ncbi:IS1595 family transposase [Janthinobacterium sp. ZB1P44]|uniref:IS1595 family transposase n=1 Tax=Janthinobacterium sp. ZB1P44 TaxID=3424192 RepID=UPI003F206196
MQPAEWIRFIAQFAQLNRRQRQAGMALLRGNTPHDATVALLEGVAQPRLACPACCSAHLHRHGHAQRRGISTEQVCILVARDRTGQTLDFVAGKGQLTKAQLHRYLLPVVDKDILLVTDGHAAYRAFAREAGLSHQAVNVRAGIRVRGAAHMQNVNAYHSRLREWLRPFHGVATRYLPNYLGWRWILDARRIRSPETLLKATLGAFPHLTVT